MLDGALDRLTELALPAPPRRGPEDLHSSAGCRSCATGLGSTPHPPPGRRDLPLDRVPAGEDAVRLPVPVPRVVEIPLEGMDDAVEPCRQRGLLLLDDRVGLLPRSGRQELDGPDKRISRSGRIGEVHAVIITPGDVVAPDGSPRASGAQLLTAPSRSHQGEERRVCELPAGSPRAAQTSRGTPSSHAPTGRVGPPKRVSQAARERRGDGARLPAASRLLQSVETGAGHLLVLLGGGAAHYGDIRSDLDAETAGGLGLAPSGNFGDGLGLLRVGPRRRASPDTVSPTPPRRSCRRR
jgi:hypothetical protein